MEFINNKIKNIYNNNIGHGNSEKRLLCLKAHSLYSKDHNKKIIESLINDEDEKRINYFTNLFGLKFEDCLKNFKGEKI